MLRPLGRDLELAIEPAAPLSYPHLLGDLGGYWHAGDYEGSADCVNLYRGQVPIPLSLNVMFLSGRIGRKSALQSKALDDSLRQGFCRASERPDR